MFEEFTYSAYRQLLESFRRTHQVIPLGDSTAAVRAERYFVLRHDIDYSPDAALRMAELESDLSVRATYFLLLSTPYYNLLSEDYCTFPRKLISLGHDVGFHFDVAALAGVGEENLESVLQSQVAVLEQLTGKPVRSIAMHNPSVSGNDPFKNHPKFLNAYDDISVRDGAYFSDSCGAWRPETMKVFRSGILPSRFQLLVHPIFWGEDHRDQWTRLDQAVRKIIENLEAQITDQKKLWSQHPAVIHQMGRKAKEECL